MLEASFDGWVQRARDIFREESEYPLIDDQTIEMSDELVGSWPASFGSGGVMAFLEDRLLGGGSLPVRFVVLNFLFRLWHFEGIEQEWAVAQARESISKRLAEMVRSVDIEVLNDPREIRWETVNSCAIRDWTRASELYQRLASLGLISPAEHRALLAQMHVWRVIMARAKRDDPVEILTWWEPQLDQSWDLRSYELFYWAIELSSDAEYSDAHKEILSDAAHCWELAFQSMPDLHRSYRVAWAKCDFLQQTYPRAAQNYLHLLDPGVEAGEDFDCIIRFNALKNAADCHKRGGDTKSAIRLLERCSQEFPKARDVWPELAALYTSSPLDVGVEKVVACLRKEEEIDPTFGEAPLASIALALGETAPDSLQAVLRKTAKSSADELRFLELVLSRHWPGFQSMGPDSREEWLSAVDFLWGPRSFGAQITIRLRRRMVGVFADAAEAQLRLLFDRFRADQGPAALREIPPEPKEDRFAKYLEGRHHLTLGEMIHEIGAARRLSPARYPNLKSWLALNGRALVGNWNANRAWRLNELRRQSSHGGLISEEDALELYDLSVWLISLLAEH